MSGHTAAPTIPVAERPELGSGAVSEDADVPDDPRRIPECNEERLVERFIECAEDLVCGYFDDVQRLKRDLRLIAEAARGCEPIWNEAGCGAFQALVGGLDREVGPERVRKWATLLEGLLRRLFVLTDLPLPDRPDRDTVRDLLSAAGLLSSNEPGYAVVPERLGHARAADPRANETLTLSMLRAVGYRNADAHRRWCPMDWRERFELAETVILTLLGMVARHPQIRERLVYERAAQDVPESVTAQEPTPALDWHWTFAGVEEKGDTGALIDRILNRGWPKGKRLIVKGALGVGLTTLGKRLIEGAVSSEYRSKSLLLVGAEIDPSPGPGAVEPRARVGHRDPADTLKGLLGNLWGTWWIDTALREDWLGIVLDGLDRLDTADLDRFVLDFEAVSKKWPRLRVITLRPEILPAAAVEERRRVLGPLAGGDELHIRGRSLPHCTPAPAKLERTHPARLAFWLDRGAGDYIERTPIEATRALVQRELSPDHGRHWPYVPPSLRPAASVIALAALHRLSQSLHEYRDGAHVPRLESDELGQAFNDAFNAIQEWSGELATVDVDNGAVAAAKQALLESGLVIGDDEHRAVWLAPLVEDALRPSDFLESVKQQWLGLDPEDRRSALHGPSDPG